MSFIVPTGSPTITDNPPGVPLIGWHNLVPFSTVTSTSEQASFPISNVINPATHLKWKGSTSNAGDEVITIDIPGSDGLNYVGIAGHNLGSSLATISVETLDSPPVILVDPQTVFEDTPLILRFPLQELSGVRIRIPNFVGEPEAAVIYLGELLVMERGIRVDVTHVPITFGRRTTIVNGMSETGNFLGRIVLSEHRESKAEFFGITPDFYRLQMDQFLSSAKEFPFFWAWAPSEYDIETGYVWLLNDAEPEVAPDHRHIALTLEMAGIA